MAQQTIIIRPQEHKHLVFVNPHDTAFDVSIARDAALSMHIVSIDGMTSSNSVHVTFEDHGSCLDLRGLVLTEGQQELDISTHVDHAFGDCTSRQLFKYMLADESKASFYGLLHVAQDSQHTDASQTNRNILLSSSASMRTEPELEIYADDVKCSHGASTGQLDRTAMFYMQQRCLSREDAQSLLLQAFVADVIDGLSEEVRDMVYRQIAKISENLRL